MVLRFGGWWRERVKGNERRIEAMKGFYDACAGCGLNAVYPISVSLVDLNVACVIVPAHPNLKFGKWASAPSENGSYANYTRQLRREFCSDDIKGYLRELDSEGVSLVNVHPEIWRYPEMFGSKVVPLVKYLATSGNLSAEFRKDSLAEALVPFPASQGRHRLAAEVSLEKQAYSEVHRAKEDINTEFRMRSDKGRISLGEIAVSIPVGTRVSYAVLDDIGAVDRSVRDSRTCEGGTTSYIDSGTIRTPALVKNGVPRVGIETLGTRLRFVLPKDFTLGFDNMTQGLEAIKVVEDAAMKVLKNTTTL